MHRLTDTQARLAADNLALVGWAVKKWFSGYSWEWREELESEARWALVRAAVNFNPDLGFRFSTYAANVIYRECCKRLRVLEANENLLHYSTETADDWWGEERLREDDMEVVRNRAAKLLGSAVLSRVEREYLKRRYCGGDRYCDTNEVLAAELGVTTQAVQCAVKRALGKLRQWEGAV